MQAIFLDDDSRVNAFVTSVSKPRLRKYLKSRNGDIRSALLVYHWNSKLSQSLYLPLQTWEIVLRNKFNEFFIYKYGKNWPYSISARRNFTKYDRNALIKAITRLSNKSTTEPSTDRIVAALSAGFWVNQFRKTYEAHYGWQKNLTSKIFVNNASVTRHQAEAISADLLELRNRVAHHEPIYSLDLRDLRDNIDFMLRAMCPAAADYMSSACSFADLWNEEPGRQLLIGQE
jgi:hypothetical protein